MYAFLLKYKQVLINGFILIYLILAAGDFGRDFFLGAASAVVLVSLGESIGDLRKTGELKKEEILE